MHSRRKPGSLNQLALWTVAELVSGGTKLEAGTVWINTWGELGTGTVPFGGFTQSGLGREHGPDALNAHTETKTVMLSL